MYTKESTIFGVNAVDFSISGRILFAGYTLSAAKNPGLKFIT